MNDWLSVLLAIVLLAAVPTAFAGVLRWAGMKAGLAAIIAGIIGGVLLGPVVLGRVRPEIHERLFLGGVEEHRQLDHLLRLRGADVLAAQMAGVQLGDRSHADLKFQADRFVSLDALAVGRFRDQWWLRSCATVLAAAMLGAIAWRRRRTSWSGVSIAHWLAPSLIAAALTRIEPKSVAMIPIASALVVQFLILRFVRPRDPRHATWACLAVMCGLAAWNLAGDLAAVMLVLVALLTEGMDTRASARGAAK